MAAVIYNGPLPLLQELVELLRQEGLDFVPPEAHPFEGCDTVSVEIPVSGPAAALQRAVSAWNDRYPPFGIGIE